MVHNVGRVDKIIRLVIGLVLLSQVFVGLQTAWGWIGLIFIGTALMNFCPLYIAVGVNTLKQKLSGK